MRLKMLRIIFRMKLNSKIKLMVFDFQNFHSLFGFIVNSREFKI